MKRRDFIQLSAFASAAISFPLLESCSPSTTEDTVSRPLFLSRLFDKQTINDAGKAYIEKTPTENNKNKLIQLLSDESSIADSYDPNAIHLYLDQKVKNDFETGSTLLVNGWVLSVTEARQCALYFLIKYP